MPMIVNILADHLNWNNSFLTEPHDANAFFFFFLVFSTCFEAYNEDVLRSAGLAISEIIQLIKKKIEYFVAIYFLEHLTS